MCTWVGEEGEKGGEETKGHSGDRTWEEDYGENRLPCFSFPSTSLSARLLGQTSKNISRPSAGAFAIFGGGRLY